MVTADWVGLAGIVVTSVVGPYIVAKQKANEKKANQSADIHVSNAQVLSKLVEAMASLHTKVDEINTVGKDTTLSESLHRIESGIDILKDRGTR